MRYRGYTKKRKRESYITEQREPYNRTKRARQQNKESHITE
jgi:hypothetical protein